MNPRILIAIDFGGSKTIVVVYDLDNDSVLDVEVGPACKLHDMTVDEVLDRFRSILGGIELDGVSAIAMGVAGLDTKYDWMVWNDIVKSVVPGDVDTLVMHDVEALYYAAGFGEPCIVVIAGTGFNVYGSNNRVSAKAGDWGWRIGDEASAYRIGVSILNNVFRYVDGRGGSETLYRAVLSELGLGDWEDLLDWVYKAGVDDIAGLARLGCILVDDPVVKRIFLDAVSEAVFSVEAVARKVGLKGPVHYTGGLFNCLFYRDVFIRMLLDKGYSIGRYVEYPVVGPVVKVLMDRYGFGRDEVTRRANAIEEYLRRKGL